MQGNESDNNRNRNYERVDNRIRDTFAGDSSSVNKTKLFDPYVRFFRWASDQLGNRAGVVCYVSNNSFIDQVAYDGFRKHLLKDFYQIYHLDLHGNVRRNAKLSGTTHNVFGIQVGVGVTIAIRRPTPTPLQSFHYHRVPENWTKHEKLIWLDEKNTRDIDWELLVPGQDGTLLSVAHEKHYRHLLPIASRHAKQKRSGAEMVILEAFSLGVQTNRDSTVYDYLPERLEERIRAFIDAYNGEVDRYKREPQPVEIDSFVNRKALKWSYNLKLDIARGRYAEFASEKVRLAQYRPFNTKSLFFDRTLNEKFFGLAEIFPTSESERDNVAFCATGPGAERPFAVFSTTYIPDLNFFGPGSVPQWYPYYVYEEDGTNRRENITDWALKTFRDHYADKKITKWDIFYYVYGILHHPGYREKYGDNLKRELPPHSLRPRLPRLRQGRQATRRSPPQLRNR